MGAQDETKKTPVCTEYPWVSSEQPYKIIQCLFECVESANMFVEVSMLVEANSVTR